MTADPAKDRDFEDYQPDTLYFLPLGGGDDFSGHLNLYTWNDQWLMVDCGGAFANQGVGQVEIQLPDPAYIERRRNKLVGLVLTHGHEDHIGAVVRLWPHLRCPVYATPFVAAYLRQRMDEYPEARGMPLHVVQRGDSFALGPFGVRMLPVTHSIPEPCMLEITTPAGRVIHTGDWKMDPAPLIGPPFDPDLFRAIGQRGVLAVIADSTNATVPGTSGSEAEVRDGLTALFARLPNRIFVTCIARNSARLRSIAEAARDNGREVALIGRSLWTFAHIATDLGYFDGLPAFLSPRKAARLAPDRIVFIATGNQGEANAALSRIALGEHRDIALVRGDHVVFSARVIPECAEAVALLRSRLKAQGAHLLIKEETPERIYASGHPAQDEVKQLYHWLKPQVLIPVHGQTPHLEANAALGRSCGIPSIVTPRSGGVVRLVSGSAEVVGRVRIGRLAPVPLPAPSHPRPGNV